MCCNHRGADNSIPFGCHTPTVVPATLYMLIEYLQISKYTTAQLPYSFLPFWQLFFNIFLSLQAVNAQYFQVLKIGAPGQLI